MSKSLFFTLSSFLLALFGFFIATYLTILHYKNVIPPCSLAHGCETVLTSKYSMIGPIPLALIGVAYFLILLVIFGIKLQISSESRIMNHESTNHNSYFLIHNSIFFLIALAFLISLILVGLQAFVIHAFCQWCLTVETINLILFTLTLLQRRFE